MRVVVVGGGIVGVCTAWALVEAGCEVTVVERNAGVAQEASYGNAGMMAAPYVAPWAAPGMPRKVLSMLFARHAPVRFDPSADVALWRWIGRWLGECTAARFRVNKARMQRLAYYSLSVMDELRPRFGLSYERTTGMLQLFRGERDLTLAQATIAFLAEAGVPHRLLSPAECRAHEPGLSDIVFEGGLHLPDAEAGNCPLVRAATEDALRGARRALRVRSRRRRDPRRRRRRRDPRCAARTAARSGAPTPSSWRPASRASRCCAASARRCRSIR